MFVSSFSNDTNMWKIAFCDSVQYSNADTGDRTWDNVLFVLAPGKKVKDLFTWWI